VGSGVSVTSTLCASIATTTYIKCYDGAGTGSQDPKPYKNYDDNLSSPIYKQYANTKQSMYANIKDGLRNLQTKFPVNQITTSTTPTGTTTTYSGIEREIVVGTENSVET
jgi:hypothetical protein